MRRRIDSLGWNLPVVNGGLSGETSAGGLRRIDWMLRRHVDLFVLELGGNDGLRGIDLASTRQNLQQIIDKVRNAYPEARIVIAGMQVPPNLGPGLHRAFRVDVSRAGPAERRHAHSLAGWRVSAATRNSMQNDGIHPTRGAMKRWPRPSGRPSGPSCRRCAPPEILDPPAAALILIPLFRTFQPFCNPIQRAMFQRYNSACS
ncbi:MAG: GDSL-type esterase/lipase family protein [Balneolaceae bacterium]|nr:GDSL-type esterase/lipase family protein [Balneolaceae bacterium]